MQNYPTGCICSSVSCPLWVYGAKYKKKDAPSRRKCACRFVSLNRSNRQTNHTLLYRWIAESRARYFFTTSSLETQWHCWTTFSFWRVCSWGSLVSTDLMDLRNKSTAFSPCRLERCCKMHVVFLFLSSSKGQYEFVLRPRSSRHCFFISWCWWQCDIKMFLHRRSCNNTFLV